ncbi:oxidoreductase [Sphingomonas sp. FW199]|uniref:oxidoreductase n=1 Tax=Sphingomonas sp. FW199 TaxID=3400217 RepID=UPI003CF1BD27
MTGLNVSNWLITGVGRGLGHSLARAALERGDYVVGTVRTDADRRRFEAMAPGRAHALIVDLGDHHSIPAAVATAEALLGRIDLLVSNAGYGMVGAIEETGIAEARALMDVNLFGAVALIQAALPAMRERRSGHIVIITSLSGFAPWWGTGIYGASKYALECIGQTLAQELAPLGIAVTNVAPGGMRTAFAGDSLVEASGRIADYDTGARQSRQSLMAGHRHEAGDPDRCAAAILAALGADLPPRHLFLGEDALRHAREHFVMLETEMKQWEALSLSTAHADRMATS